MEGKAPLMRFALAAGLLIFVAFARGAARADDLRPPDRLVQINRAALEDVDNLEWDDAKKKLLDALIIGKKAGLDNHPLMARTYVHLGFVYVAGFKNREKALQCFVRALEIQPDIKVTPTLAAAEVNDTFAEAARQARSVQRFAVPPSLPEPDLPARVNALECYYAETTRVDQAVPVRCAVASSLDVTKVFVFYREPDKQRFTEAEMKRTPKGWFAGRVPERVIYGTSLQLYFEGRLTTGKPIVRNGEADSPNVILIVKR
jgi:tetratricopeptide (TPR) repeat protein